jgi:hypothetical protein
MAKNESKTAPAEPVRHENPSRQPSSAGAKVVVACKLPHGLRIRPFKMMNERELVLGGGSREQPVARAIGPAVLIQGTAVPYGTIPKCRMAAGYAITEGVDKDLWDSWFANNKDTAMVENGLIGAHDTAERAIDFAKEHAKTRSGMEPFLKKGDPRAPKSPLPQLSEVEQDEEQAGRTAATG